MRAQAPIAGLRVEGRCPECGAPFETGLWDRAHRCEFCGSQLVSGRCFGDEIFVVANRPTDPDPRLPVVERDADAYRSRLRMRAGPEGELQLDLGGWADAQVERFRDRQLACLHVVKTLDFFAPYRIHEQTVLQAILGRRARPLETKESYIQCFRTEDLERRYERGVFNLRDAGLKIRGMQLQLVSEAHLELAEGRFLEEAEETDADRPVSIRSKMCMQPRAQVIRRLDGVWSDRHIMVYKNYTYAHLLRDGRDEHYLLDRQFGGVAGRLSGEEAEVFHAIQPRPLSQILRPPQLSSIASECPNCGWELELPETERIVFCPTCRTGMEVLPKGLRPIQYRLAGTTPSSTRCLYFPFWAFDVQIRTSAGSFTRLWDWLESTSRQALGAEWRETDPAQARLFLPARPLLGTPELDDAFSDLVAWASWRQPELIADRTSAVEGAEMLGAELEAEQARGLARYALPALHDRQSTRSLSGMTFRSAIGDAEIQLGSPELVCVPLELEGNRWTPGSPLRGASESLLRTDADAPRLTRSFNLPT